MRDDLRTESHQKRDRVTQGSAPIKAMNVIGVIVNQSSSWKSNRNERRQRIGNKLGILEPRYGSQGVTLMASLSGNSKRQILAASLNGESERQVWMAILSGKSKQRV